MGIDLAGAPESFTSKIAQAPSTAPDPQSDPHPQAKRGTKESWEQEEFKKWVAFEKASGRRIVIVHHGMHKRSTATLGCPDFYIGINGFSLWFEFKRDYTCHLSKEQEEFRLDCEANNIYFFVVYSGQEAINIVEEFRKPLYEKNPGQ